MGREHLTADEQAGLEEYARSLPDLAEPVQQAGEQLETGAQAVNRQAWDEAVRHVAEAQRIIGELLRQFERLSPPPEPRRLNEAHRQLIQALRLQLEGLTQIRESAEQQDLTGYFNATQLYDQGLLTVIELMDRIRDIIAEYST